MRGSLTLKIALAALVVVSGVVWYSGSENPVTPAGYVGYLTQGSVFGKTKFIGLQKGPTSPGRTWLMHSVNVSITPYTYTENFDKDSAVLAKDNLKLAFSVHILFKIDEERVKDFVERYSALHEGDAPDKVVQIAYDNYLKEPLRTYARDEIQQHDGLSVKDNIGPIGEKIVARVMKLTEDTPFKVMSVVVGNVQYPQQVADAVSLKLAATQDLEKKLTQIEMSKRDADMRVIEAQGIAKSMAVINDRLTPMYLQHEAIEAQKAMVNSPNHSTVYIPVGANGVPIVGNLDIAPRTRPAPTPSESK